MVSSPRAFIPSLWPRRRGLWSWLCVVCSVSVILGLFAVPLVADVVHTGEVHQAASSPAPAPPPIPSPFLRLYSMLAFSILAYIPQWLFGDRKDCRMALRYGMAGGFVLSGIDHFVNTETRYVPMIPAFLAPHGVELVYGTGVAELAGALGLVVPLAIYHRLGLPNLRQWAGIGIALMLTGLMVANVNIAVQASSGAHLAFAAWTYWLRLLFQPLFVVWALYASGVM
jgi:uncharacterized membrane protein